MGTRPNDLIHLDNGGQMRSGVLASFFFGGGEGTGGAHRTCVFSLIDHNYQI